MKDVKQTVQSVEEHMGRPITEKPEPEPTLPDVKSEPTPEPETEADENNKGKPGIKE